jgi:hypothetical protein
MKYGRHHVSISSKAANPTGDPELLLGGSSSTAVNFVEVFIALSEQQDLT